MPDALIQVVLILAPLFLGLSLHAYLRVRRYVCDGAHPIAAFRQMRWNSCIIVSGAVFVLVGAVRAHGILAQVSGALLALEFLCVAYANFQVVMSTRGVLIGMRFSPWVRFSGYDWRPDGRLQLNTRKGRRHDLRVPDQVKQDVQEIVDLNILR